jgi:hypothetical protein
MDSPAGYDHLNLAAELDYPSVVFLSDGIGGTFHDLRIGCPESEKIQHAKGVKAPGRAEAFYSPERRIETILLRGARIKPYPRNRFGREQFFPPVDQSVAVGTAWAENTLVLHTPISPALNSFLKEATEEMM